MCQSLSRSRCKAGLVHTILSLSSHLQTTPPCAACVHPGAVTEFYQHQQVAGTHGER